MSADAIRFVQRYSCAKGIERSVQMAIARASRHRVEPFGACISYEEIAMECGITERGAKGIVKRMLDNGHLYLVEKGTGHRKNSYEIATKRGEPPYTPGVHAVHPIIRGDVIAHSRADNPPDEVRKSLYAQIDEEYSGRVEESAPNIITMPQQTRQKNRPKKTQRDGNASI